MTIKKASLGAVLGATLFVCGLAIGQQDIDPGRHPDLAGAQQFISQALGKIDSAQKAWGDHLGGHAEKAKQLLLQADGELKQAALYANAHK